MHTSTCESFGDLGLYLTAADRYLSCIQFVFIVMFSFKVILCSKCFSYSPVLCNFAFIYMWDLFHRTVPILFYRFVFDSNNDRQLYPHERSFCNHYVCVIISRSQTCLMCHSDTTVYAPLNCFMQTS